MTVSHAPAARAVPLVRGISRWWTLLAVVLTTPMLGAPAAVAASCTPDDFAAAVDEAGARLRAFNAEASPKLLAALKKLKDRKGWTGPDADDRVHDLIADKKMQALDQQADELLVNIDALGRPPEKGVPDCAKLDELRAAGVELLAVMRAKSAHSLARVEAALGAGETAAASPPAASPSPASPSSSSSAAATPGKPAAPSKPPATPSAPSAVPPAAPPAAAGTAAKSDAWSAATEVQPAPAGPDPVFVTPSEDGFTIDEIREVTRGFFGTISTELASVIEHAFRKSGRPAAYILGQEGGGAFLAGLRYGNGTLYPRRGTARPIYWHGPSVGYDFGAAGSRTLFLIYGLDQPDAIHRRFAGIDGSAYLVGGVGVTYLRGGNIVLAPIRTGLGLRLGASIGFVRFTPQATWNPF